MPTSTAAPTRSGSPFFPGPSDEAVLRDDAAHIELLPVLRFLCGLAAAFVLLFWAFYQVEVPGAVDPLWSRGLAAVLPGSLFVASYLSAWVRDRFDILMRGTLYALLAWFTGLTVVNGLGPNYAVGLLFTFFAIGVAASVGVRRTRPVQRFLGFGVVLISGAAWWSGPTPVGTGIFITSTAGLALVLYVAVHTYLRSQQALRDSEDRFRAVFEGAVPGIAILDADRQVQRVNPAFERILGRTDETLRGTSIDALLHPDDADADRERFAALLAGERDRYEVEQRFTSAEDDVVWSQYGVSVLPTGANGTRLVAFLVDITERKHLEGQLRQAQKMETIGTLAGGIAHDFNNILHSATLYLEMAIEESSARVQESLRQMQQALHRAEELVEKLLTFSRQSDEAVEERFDLTTVAEEAIGLVRPSIPDGVVVDATLADAAPAVGDPGQMHQVLTNLLTNAAEAMEASGAQSSDDAPDRLDVEVRTLHVDADLARRFVTLEPGQYVRLTVSDTGPGMDAETQEHLFEPFYTTKGDEGTGLGLSVVHGIVQAHNGEITTRSEPGEGTTFNVYLPHAEDPGAPAPDTPADTPDRPPHVLLVDDDAQTLDLEADRLQRLGVRVTACNAPDAALDALADADGDVDLVLTDYDMPTMTGITLARKMRSIDTTLPVVLASGLSAQVSTDEAEAAGIDAFLRKPIGTDAMTDLLHRYTDLERDA